MSAQRFFIAPRDDPSSPICLFFSNAAAALDGLTSPIYGRERGEECGGMSALLSYIMHYYPPQACKCKGHSKATEDGERRFSFFRGKKRPYGNEFQRGRVEDLQTSLPLWQIFFLLLLEKCIFSFFSPCSSPAMFLEEEGRQAGGQWHRCHAMPPPPPPHITPSHLHAHLLSFH